MTVSVCKKSPEGLTGLPCRSQAQDALHEASTSIRTSVGQYSEFVIDLLLDDRLQ